MRDIKFRARNANLPRCWIYGYFVIENGCNYIINDEGKFMVIADTECQYINLHDKNKKEIYEGDILKAVLEEWEGNENGDGWFAEKIIYGVVKINPIRIRMKIVKVECEDEDLEPHFLIGKLMSIKTKYDEIIGNQFENSELLKYPEKESKINEEDIPF